MIKTFFDFFVCLFFKNIKIKNEFIKGISVVKQNLSFYFGFRYTQHFWKDQFKLHFKLWCKAGNTNKLLLISFLSFFISLLTKYGSWLDVLYKLCSSHSKLDEIYVAEKFLIVKFYLTCEESYFQKRVGFFYSSPWNDGQTDPLKNVYWKPKVKFHKAYTFRIIAVNLYDNNGNDNTKTNAIS